MSRSLALLTVIAWLAVPIARAQTPATRPATVQADAGRPATNAVHASRHSSSRRPRSRPIPGTHKGSAAGKSGGVLALGATDITGNKELPKVMVIVPWKGSLGAGGVIKPTDSLLDEVLQPVDRGVFQRQIHYYGQLRAAGQRASRVAPVGDRH